MRIVVTGASGRLGSEVVDRLRRAGRHEVFGWSGTTRGRRAEPSLRPVDLADEPALAEALEEADPEAVIHAGALSSAEAVRRDPARARAVNVEATRHLAEWAAARGRRLVFTSTDLVFDGSRSWNREDDPARPILAYGRTKLEAESHVLRVPRGLVARLSLLFGRTRSGIPDFFGQAIDALGRGESRSFFEDEFRTPLRLSHGRRDPRAPPRVRCGRDHPCRRSGADEPIRADASGGDRLGDRSRPHSPRSPGRRRPPRTPARRCFARHLPAGRSIPFPGAALDRSRPGRWAISLHGTGPSDRASRVENGHGGDGSSTRAFHETRTCSDRPPPWPTRIYNCLQKSGRRSREKNASPPPLPERNRVG